MDMTTGKGKKISLIKSNIVKKRHHGHRDNIEYLIMSMPSILHIFLFAYLPMFGIIIAFKDYRFDKGILGSEWVGFRNFEFFFHSDILWRVTRNTVAWNILFMIVGLFSAVGVAILLAEIKKRIYVKAYQTVMILPYFLSWVVVSFLVYIILHPFYGVFNQLLNTIGFDSVSWYTEPRYWPVILTCITVWKSTGLNSIIYYAALMGIDSELFESANIDGANKWQEIRYITIPCLVPLMIILTILALGNIFHADFGLFYQVTRDQPLLYSTTDVIDTYVFRAVYKLHDYTMSSAVGLYQSAVGFVLIMTTNCIVRKVEKDNALF